MSVLLAPVLRFKIAPPALPVCIDRPRLMDAAAARPIVALSAPAGYGKTCLGSQLAAATPGPTAWFTADELDRDRAAVVSHVLASLAGAWHDLGTRDPDALDDDAAVGVLGATLETLAGPGCIVLDDVHLLAPDVLDAVLRVTFAATPPDVRLVVATCAGVGPRLLQEASAGRAIVLGATALTFDEEECGRADAFHDDDTYRRTGGWPLAVGLAAHTGRSLGGRRLDDEPGALASVAVADLDPPAHELLLVVARLPRCPRRLGGLGPAAAVLEAFLDANPVLSAGDVEWWSLREWARELWRRQPADPTIVDAVAAALLDMGETELAARLFVAEARYADATPLIEQLASDGLRLGRPTWARSLIAEVPSGARSFELELLATAAAQALSIIDQEVPDAATLCTLLRLVEAASAHGEDALLRSRAMLASHYRMAGDTRVVALCEEALGRRTIEAVAAGRVDEWVAASARSSPNVGWAIGELLRYYGLALAFTRDPRSIAAGRRFVGLALDMLDRAGRPTTSQRAWWTYMEALLHLRRAAEAVRDVRLAAHRLSALEHADAAVRMAELATLEFFVGDDTAARRSIEQARELADRTAHRIALVPLDAIELALDVADAGFATCHADRFDTIAAELAVDERLAPFESLITAEFGIALVRQGHVEAARSYLARAEAALGSTLATHTTSLRCRRLRGLILLAVGDSAGGREALTALRDEAAAEGRVGIVETIDGDLGANDGGDRPLARRATPPIEVQVLAPEVVVRVGGDAVVAPRGYPAKLLALLVVANGLMTIDAAIEGLWPGADPVVGRNRLHGVILRLRRGLGLAADGPIGCTDGLVRLERSAELTIDSWEFERLAARAESCPAERRAAIAAYGGDVLSVQLAYDDNVESYRRALRRRFVRLARAVLAEPPGDLDDEAVTGLALHVTAVVPDDDELARVASRVLAGRWHDRSA